MVPECNASFMSHASENDIFWQKIKLYLLNHLWNNSERTNGTNNTNKNIVVQYFVYLKISIHSRELDRMPCPSFSLTRSFATGTVAHVSNGEHRT